MSRDIHCPECGCDISGDYFSADAMRRRFFACLRDAHANMREPHTQMWPNPEALRKAALIAIGHCDTLMVPVGSKTNAPGVANAFRMKDQYCLAQVQGDVVVIYTARSMSRRVLPKKQFLETADKVFAWIAAKTGIDPSQSIEGRAA